jgi:hypothetical protein
MEPLIAGASWTDVPARSAAFLVLSEISCSERTQRGLGATILV